MKWSIFDSENAELLDEIKNTYKITSEQFQEIREKVISSKRKITSCLYEGSISNADDSSRIMGKVSRKAFKPRKVQHVEFNADNIRDIISRNSKGLMPKQYVAVALQSGDGNELTGFALGRPSLRKLTASIIECREIRTSVHVEINQVLILEEIKGERVVNHGFKRNRRKGALGNSVNSNLRVVRIVSDDPFQNDEAVGSISEA